MNYEDEDIQGLMNDLSGIGLSRRSIVNKTHYGFGKDLQGVNDGETLFYITKGGADLLQEGGFGRWIKDTTFAIVWSKWDKSPDRSWTQFPLPVGEVIPEDLIVVTLFQSSPRMYFPGEISPEGVKMGYDLLVDEIKSVRLSELG